MQKPKYCLPIIKNSKQDILKVITDNISDYDYFEIWLDYISDLNDEFVDDLKELLKEKLILLFRRQNLEPIKMDLAKRLQIISILNNSSSLLDLDITSQQEELSYIKDSQLEINTIISYHNYQQTPDAKDLAELASRISECQPTILKIATMCKTEKDALRLLQLLLELKQVGLKYIILGMGECGVITRIFGTLWGNEMVFAPKNSAEKSAPGQLTKEQLETIFSKIQQ